MTAFYNEIDPFAADWLDGLIADGQIAPGWADWQLWQALAHEALSAQRHIV